jgi:hypothetical protein
MEYSYDKSSSTVDCSTLVTLAYKRALGRALSGNANSIGAKDGVLVDGGNVPPATSKLAPGDIIYLNWGWGPARDKQGNLIPGKKTRRHGHVGIYDGRGNIIHSTSVGRHRAIIEPFSNWKKYSSHMSARRIIGTIANPAKPIKDPVLDAPVSAPNDSGDTNDPSLENEDDSLPPKNAAEWTDEEADTYTSYPAGEEVTPGDEAPPDEIPAGTGITVPVKSELMSNAIQRPFDYLFNVVKALLEKKIPSAVRTIPAANFFIRWARITNFVNRFTAFPVFDDMRDDNVFPVLKALQGVNALDVLVKKLLPQMQNAGTLYDMLQLVYGQVFMEVAMLPMMPLVRTDLQTGAIEYTPFESHTLAQDPAENNLYVNDSEIILQKPNRIPNYFAKPQLLFGLPPSCNVLFPSQIKTLSYTENITTQPTRIYFNDETVNNLLKSQGVISTAISNALATGYPPEVDAGNQIRVKGGSTVNGKNFLLFPEEFFKGPVMDRRPVPPWLFFLRQAQFAKQGPLPEKEIPAGVFATTESVSGSGTTTAASTSTVTRAASAESRFVNFVWPLPKSANGRSPIISRKYEADLQLPGDVLQFAGVGIAYARDSQDVPGAGATAVPPGTLCVAAGAGEVTLVQETSAGLSVRIQHDGTPWITVYTFMKPSTTLRVHKGMSVIPGTPLGEVGYHLKDEQQVYSLHFSLFQQVSEDEASINTDPTRLLALWGVVDKPVIPIISTTLTPAFEPSETPAAVASSSRIEPKINNEALFTHLRTEPENVYQLYAKYEFYRERYSKRSGTAHLSWNPYVVPGFPAAFFDQRATRVDVFSYVTTVQHHMSWSAFSTNVTFVYGRTIQEVFALLRHEFDGGSTVLSTAPQEPIYDIRKVIQDFDSAEEVYQQLFYGKRQLYKKNASFDWRKIIGFAPLLLSDPPERIYLAGKDATEKEGASNAAARITAKQPVIDKAVVLRDKAIALEDSAGEELAEMEAPPPASSEPTVVDGTPPLDTEVLIDFVLELGKGAIRKQQLEKLIREAKAAQVAAEDEITRVATSLADDQQVVDAYQADLALHGATVQTNIAGNREIVPLPTAEPLFQEYDAAMAYNWRPICTLDEYVIFHDGAGEDPIPAAGHERSLGARYFGRIRRMTPLGDYKLPPGADGLGTTPEPAVPLGPANPKKADPYALGTAAGKGLAAALERTQVRKTKEGEESGTEDEKKVRKYMKALGVSAREINEAVDALKNANIGNWQNPDTSLVATVEAQKVVFGALFTDMLYKASQVFDPEEDVSWFALYRKQQDAVSYDDVLKFAYDAIMSAVENDEDRIAAQAAAARAGDVDALKKLEAEATKDMTKVPGLHSSTGPHGSNGPEDFPQTRADWDTILLAYRNNVYVVKAPRT